MRNKYYTVKELSKELSLNPQYIRDLARMGAIPAKKIGSMWRFDLEEVDQKLSQNGVLAVQNAREKQKNK